MYRYERVIDLYGFHFRISNRNDDRVATCYDEGNAKDVVRLLNIGLCGGNYVANHDTYPTEMTFENGRRVRAVKTDDGMAVLEIV